MPKATKVNIPRGPNCWILFAKSFCKIEREFRIIKQKDAIREAKIKWNSMSDIEKQPWRELAQERKKLIQLEYLNFDQFVMEDPSPASQQTNQIKEIENKAVEDLNKWFSEYIYEEMCEENCFIV